MRPTHCLAVVFAVCLLAGLSRGALTQEATPAGDFVTPDPSECRIEPRTIESVIVLTGTPVPTPPAIPSLEGGEPASAAVAAGVTAVARESVACFNAGDFLRQFAFYTDAAILAIMPPGLTAEDLTDFLGTPPQPLPEEGRESVAVRDVMVLPGGRVTAYFLMRNPEGTFTTFVTLEERGDGYVITSDIDFAAEFTTPAAA